MLRMWFWLLCIAVVVGCGYSGDDGGYYNNDPCSYSNFSRERTGKELIHLHLDSSLSGVLPLQYRNTTTVFENPANKAQMSLLLSGPFASFEKKWAFSRSDTDLRCGPFKWNDFGTLDAEDVKYSGSYNGIYDLKIQRYLVNGEFHNTEKYFDSIGFAKSFQLERIYWMSYILPFNLKDTSLKASQVFHPTIQLGNKSYDSIFELKRTNVNENLIEPHGLYYAPKHGVVGFYLTNHQEEWFKK